MFYFITASCTMCKQENGKFIPVWQLPGNKRFTKAWKVHWEAENKASCEAIILVHCQWRLYEINNQLPGKATNQKPKKPNTYWIKWKTISSRKKPLIFSYKTIWSVKGKKFCFMDVIENIMVNKYHFFLSGRQLDLLFPITPGAREIILPFVFKVKNICNIPYGPSMNSIQ